MKAPIQALPPKRKRQRSRNLASRSETDLQELIGHDQAEPATRAMRAVWSSNEDNDPDEKPPDNCGEPDRAFTELISSLNRNHVSLNMKNCDRGIFFALTLSSQKRPQPFPERECAQFSGLR
jgi:hypothetical protein